MKLLRIGLPLLLLALAALAGGCGSKEKPITDLERKKAGHLAAEANFAINLRDWGRAEKLLAEAVQNNPESGAYWVSLGAMRVRLGNKAGAKEAYQSGLKAYQKEAERDLAKKDPQPWLMQVQVLALLGRTSEAKTLIEKTVKRFPDNRSVRVFVEEKHFEKMMADPVFKQGAI